jgi:hypothetical protein
MNTIEIQQAGKKLLNNNVLFGHLIRMQAVKKLAADSSADAIPHLITALLLSDIKVADIAYKALQLLKNQTAIDMLCKHWYSSRDKKLEEIILKCAYVAAKPIEIQQATNLKTSQLKSPENKDIIDLLIRFVTDKDSVISQNANTTLQLISNQDMQDYFCEGIITGKYDGNFSEIAISKQYKPSNISRRCLFYVITGQIEQYFDLDFEFEHLRAEYYAAPEELQQRVRSVIQQSSDKRLMGLFGELRKKFVAKELSTHEAELMLDVYSRNKQWEEIFALLFFAPLVVLPKALAVLVKSEWEPADDEAKALWEALMKHFKTMGEHPNTPTEPEVALGPVFSKWFEQGRNEFINKPEAQLRQLLKEAAPPEAIPALAAVISKKLLNEQDKQVLEKHPHWMLRMAYIALGQQSTDVVLHGQSVALSGPGEFWLKHSPALLGQAFLQLRAAALSPEHLQQLNAVSDKTQKNTNELKHWAILLTLLSGFTLRNTIVIGAYEKRIEDTAISI